jgi:hypothetical protein
MKQQQLMGTHMLVTIAGLEYIIGFFQPLRLGFETRIETLCSLGVLPPTLHALTNHAETDVATLGGLVPATNPPHFQPQSAEGSETASPPAPVPTPLGSSANTSDDDLDADGDYEMGESEDDEDSSYADDDSETTDQEFFTAAADASVGRQRRD